MRREAALAGVLAALLYFLTRSRNHAETEDTLRYAAQVRDNDAAHLFHHAHLVYKWIGWAAWKATEPLGVDGPLVPMLIVESIIPAAVTVALSWVILRRAGVSRAATGIGCATFAVSYGYWWNAADAEVYAFASLTRVLAVGAFLAVLAKPDSQRRWVLAGLAVGLAVVAHASSVLLFVPMAVVAVVVLRRRPGAPVRMVAIGFVVAVASFAVPYCVAFAANDLGSVSEVRTYMTEYTGSGRWGRFTAKTPVEAANGAGRATVGGHFLLRFDPVLDVAERSGKFFHEERVLAAGFSTPEAVALGLVGAASLAVLAVGTLAGVGRLRRAAPSPKRDLFLAAGASLSAFAAFHLWWETANIELWGAMAPLAGMLVALLVDGSSARLRRALVVAVAGVAVVNLVGSVVPQTDPAKDVWLERTEPYVELLEPGDLLVVGHGLLRNYVGYHVEGVDLIEVGEELFTTTPEELADELLREAGTRRVYISTTALDPDRALGAGQVEEVVAFGAELEVLLDDHLEPVPGRDEADDVVYRLDGPAS